MRVPVTGLKGFAGSGNRDLSVEELSVDACPKWVEGERPSMIRGYNSCFYNAELVF